MINSLSAQHGSSVRLRLIAKHLNTHCASLTLVEAKKSLLHSLFYFIHCCLKKNFSVLFVQKFNPLTLACMIIARLQRKYVWADWDDFDHDMQGNLALKYCIAWCEWLGPKLSHTVSSHSHLILKHVPKHKQYFLPQTIDESFFLPLPSQKQDPCFIKHCYHIPDDAQLVGYMCTFTHGGMIDLQHILNVWQSMLLTDKNVFFVLLAGGPLQSKARQLIDEKQLSEHVILTGFLDREKTKRWLRQLDLAHIYLSDRPANQVRVSLKLCEYLALGLPVVGQCIGETEQQLGQWVYPAHLNTMAEKSWAFLQSPQNFPVLPKFAWPSTQQSLAKLAETLKKAYTLFYA